MKRKDRRAVVNYVVRNQRVALPIFNQCLPVTPQLGLYYHGFFMLMFYKSCLSVSFDVIEVAQ